MRNLKQKHRSTAVYLTPVLITLASILAVSLLPPVPQWLSYHDFADTREIWGIANFWNVVSNLPFCLVGIAGYFALKRAVNLICWQESILFFILFSAVILTGIGSAWYHLAPDNYRLVWDRIPMTIIFMSLLSLTIMERINLKTGFYLWPILLIFGISSVWYWIWTESLGRGDLRAYAFVQFYSIALILLILYLFPKAVPSTKSWLMLIIFYAISKIFESMDSLVYNLGGFISGHTLKHLFAAAGTYWLVIMLNELKNGQRDKNM